MRIVTEQNDIAKSLDTLELSAQQLKVLAHPRALIVLRELRKLPSHPMLLAKKLKMHEQTLYYLIHKLAEAGLIKEEITGTNAKRYVVNSSSFFVAVDDFKESSVLKKKASQFLTPFITENELCASIIVGSPDPHGPQLARSRDGYFGMDLAIFLGTFVSKFPGSVVKLDTEVSERDLVDNVIIIGGPVVNNVASKLTSGPVTFDMDKRAFVISKSKKQFVDEDIGVVCKQKSPFAKGKWVLFVAGIRNYGTRAAILSIVKHFSDFEKYAKEHEEFCAVVRGEDLDSDGIVDDAHIIGFY
jgi:DNA-binding transcriptional ArsR family regulator